MRWIRSHKGITCVILVLVIAGGIFFFSAFHDGGSAVPGINGPVTAGQEKGTEGARGLKGVFRGIFRYKTLTEENEALRDENDRLKRELAEAELSKEELAELEEMSEELKYDAVKNADIVTANITMFDGTTWLNIMNIAKGTDDGIKQNDCVISGSGLVGRVVETGTSWSKIVSIVDDQNKTSFKVSGKKKILGMLEGDGKGGMEGYTFDASANVKKGDRLVTSGMGLYPAGITIGTVTEAEYNEDSQLLMVKVDTETDFRSLTKVSVIL